MGAEDGRAAHPDPEVFRRLLASESVGAVERRRAVRHLLAGCETCSEAVRSVLSARAAAPQGYDLAFRRAELAASAACEALLAERAVRDRHRACCEALLAEAEALRRADPVAAVQVAALAATIAHGLAATAASVPELADLSARALAELGNAHRIANLLEEAEADFADAWAAFRHGSREPRLWARLADLTASLYRDQRRFPEALSLLERAVAVYERLGERHLAGRALVKLGSTAVIAEQPERAVEALLGGIERLDAGREPALAVSAVQNLLGSLADAGRPQEASRLLWRWRRLYAKGTELDRIRLRWLEGRIAGRLGEVERAARLFTEVEQGFERRDLPYDAALAALERASLWLQAGRAPELAAEVEGLFSSLATFENLAVHREAVLAAFALWQGVRAGEATAAMLAALRRELQALAARPRRA